MAAYTNALLLLSLPVLQVLAGVDTWHFTWPDGPKQCETVSVTFTGGMPPWQVTIVPIAAQPIVWTTQVPSYPVNASYPFTATLDLQLAAGTPYVAMVSDAEGYNEALNNPSAIQIVQPSDDDSCFAAASPLKKDFEFQVYGSVSECERSFGVTWTTTVGKSPYSCTIVPLDTSYNPWNVVLTETGSLDSSAVWRVNMTSGTRFTIIMHDAYGYGRGGAGQIYEVQTSSNSSCITQQYGGRADWPAGLQVNSVPTTTTAWASQSSQTNSASAGNSTQVASSSPSASSASSSSSTGESGISTGAIAGIAVAGAVVALGLLAFLFWFLRRKRHISNAAHETDLLGGGGGTNVEPKLEPYRPVGDPAAVPTMGYGAQGSDNGYGSNQLVNLDEYNRRPVETPGTFESTAPILSSGHAGHTERPLSGYATGKGGVAGPSPPIQSGSPGSPGSPSQGYFVRPVSSQTSDTKAASPPAGDNQSVRPVAHPLPPVPMGAAPEPEFRRHVDAGEVQQEQEIQREIVDLPPLYNEVPRRDGQ